MHMLFMAQTIMNNITTDPDPDKVLVSSCNNLKEALDGLRNSIEKYETRKTDIQRGYSIIEKSSHG